MKGDFAVNKTEKNNLGPKGDSNPLTHEPTKLYIEFSA